MLTFYEHVWLIHEHLHLKINYFTQTQELLLILTNQNFDQPN